MAAEARGVDGEVIQLGTGIGTPIDGLVQRIGGILGRDLEVVVDPRRTRPVASEVDRLVCCADRARRLLGWEPRVDLAAGLVRTIDWIREHVDRYRPGEYAV